MNILGYRIIKELGRGGMSIVYLAEQEKLSRKVALKVMASNLLDDPTFKERFIKEGRIVARLNHPNIVTIYDIGQAERHPYLAMEYVEGPNLKECIQRGMSLEDSIRTVKRIATALNMLHTHNIIHRDIKPMNILFRDDRYAVLTDFGIAKSITGGTELTRADVTLGTPGYMSPEQARGQKLDGRSDLYSLGAVFYEMLTGKQPYSGDDAFSTALKHITDPIPALPPECVFLQPIINRILAKDPNNRFRNGEEFIQSLNQLIAVGTDEIPTQATQKGTLSTAGVPTKLDEQSANYNWVTSSTRAISKFMAKWGKWPWVTGIGGLLLAGFVTIGLLWNARVDPRTQWLIDQLHGYAAVQLSKGRVLEPPGDNAVETYRNILELAPNDDKATESLEKLVDWFHNQALDDQRHRKLDAAIAMINKGLKIDPEDDDLLSLREQINVQINEQRQQREIASMLQQAQSQIDANRRFEPKNDNALATYQAVLAIEKNNQQALNGLQRLLQWLEQEAQAKLKSGNLPASSALIAQGLEIDPNHAGLRTLKGAVAKEEQLDQWRDQAKRQFDEGKLTSPAGENAYETYRRILNQAPDDKVAQAGVNRIVEQLEQLARTHLQNKDYQQSQEYIDQALKIRPDASTLLALRSQIRTGINHENKQQRAQRMLSQADELFADGHLIQATKFYENVLEIAPQNTHAVEGKRKIAGRYLQLAQSRFQTGELQVSKYLIEKGVSIVPDYPGFAPLMDTVNQAIARKSQTQDIAGLLARAAQQLAEMQLTTPPEDNAYVSYQNVLVMDPDNAQAKHGLDQIAGKYQQFALLQQHAGHPQRGLVMVKRGLGVRPQHAGLLALKQELEHEIQHANVEKQESVQDSQQTILNSLLNTARIQFDNQQLIDPEGDNAHETYLEVLRLDPKNPMALSGLKAIAERFVDLAEQKRKSGDLQQSIQLADTGLRYYPQHQGLRTLLQELKNQLNQNQPQTVSPPSQSISPVPEQTPSEPTQVWRPRGTF